MSDRLSELLRQRALLQEHMAWLDREIEGAANKPSALPTVGAVPLPALPALPEIKVAPTSPVIVSPRVVPSVSAPQSESLPAADAILDKYRVDTRNVKQDVRKGCLLYFAAAFLILGLVVVALYFALRRD
jgi:hypothetical protein